MENNNQLEQILKQQTVANNFDTILSVISDQHHDEFEYVLEHERNQERSSIMMHIDEKTLPIVKQMLHDGIEPDDKTKGYLQALTEIHQWIGHRRNPQTYDKRED